MKTDENPKVRPGEKMPILATGIPIPEEHPDKMLCVPAQRQLSTSAGNQLGASSAYHPGCATAAGQLGATSASQLSATSAAQGEEAGKCCPQESFGFVTLCCKLGASRIC